MREGNNLGSLALHRASRNILTSCVSNSLARGFVLRLMMACVAGAMTAAGSANAQTSRRTALALEVPADSDCGSEHALRARITTEGGRDETLLGSEALGASERRLRVQVEHAADGGYRARLTLSDENDRVLGERVVSSRSERCGELDDAITVIVGTFLGMSAGLDPQQEAQPDPPPKQPPNDPRRQPAPGHRDTHAEHARERLELALAAAGVVGSGTLPGAGFGGAGALSAQWRALFVELGAVLLPRATESLGAGAEARFSAWLGRVQACGEVAESARAGLLLCAGARLGALQAETRGLAENKRATRLLSELTLGLRGAVQLDESLAIYGALAATLPARGSRFYFIEGDGGQARYHQSGPGVMGELGISLRLSR